MKDFQDTIEKRKGSLINGFSICMTVTLIFTQNESVLAAIMECIL